MMGGPFSAALWIVRDLAKRGVRLERGDRLGLGAMSRVRPAAGQRLEMIWDGVEDEPRTLAMEFV